MEEKQGEVELEKSPWNIGKLTGEINEDFLPLNSDSTAPLPSKRLEIFLENCLNMKQC